MAKRKTKVLCTIPLPMAMEDFVETTRALSDAFSKQGRKTFIRNGPGCYEIFEFDNGMPEIPDYPPDEDPTARD